MERNRRALALGVLLWLLPTAGCVGVTDDAERLETMVIDTRPHDVSAFTQGLEIDGDVLYESTGLAGLSSVRATDLRSGEELRRVEIPAPYFAEGLTLAGDTLWQLTWKDNIAFARDPVTLVERSRASYDGEGWGLCARADSLVMSDGSDTLTFRDPVTFAQTGSVTLTSFNTAQLNELECAADGSVYANDWPTDNILQIDPDTGDVLAIIDASDLLPPIERVTTDALNGIAQIPGTDRFLLTGKYWPTMFEVRFVSAA